MVSIELLKKYNVPVPRYTSYPTVPHWKGELDIAKWQEHMALQIHQDANISLYIHLPFCESLCTYCGCNKMITKNHSVEQKYIDALLTEWKLYTKLMGMKPVLKELHLGGGTPTFFSGANLKLLLVHIFSNCTIPEDAEFSFEGHPNNTTREHLQTLYDLGFRRVSYGVQDNDEDVQRIINRIQPFENVKRATDMAREIGYKSVNFDLIYGLPLQTEEKMTKTIEQTISLHPDRVAFYSYAHVPWTSRGQRLFNESDLPSAEDKLALYVLGKKLFTKNGYHDIGMDHFALPGEYLYKAWQGGKLFRNFMGYTTHAGSMLIGLGVSAISDTGLAYAQNAKTLHDYYEMVAHGGLAVQKGYFLAEEDVIFKRYILDIICNRKTYFYPAHRSLLEEYTFPLLKEFEQDGLINYDAGALTVTDTGAHFLRNICSAFDLHLQRSNSSVRTYSNAV